MAVPKDREGAMESALTFLGIKYKYGNFFTPSEDNRWAARYGLTWKPNTQDRLAFNFSKRSLASVSA